MDVLDLMKADHCLIAKLFDLIKEETDRQESFGIFDEIKRELDLHFRAQEDSCFPIFLKLPAFQILVSKSYDDHKDIRKLIDELCNTPDTRDGIAFQNRILELKNHVESHVIEEECDLFELVRQELDAPERARLGGLFSMAKSKFVESAA